MMRNVLICSASIGILAISDPAAASWPCDCDNDPKPACNATVTLEGDWYEVTSSSQACSLVEWTADGEPARLNVRFGEGHVHHLGPSRPLNIEVQSCRVCWDERFNPKPEPEPKPEEPEPSSDDEMSAKERARQRMAQARDHTLDTNDGLDFSETEDFIAKVEERALEQRRRNQELTEQRHREERARQQQGQRENSGSSGFASFLGGLAEGYARSKGTTFGMNPLTGEPLPDDPQSALVADALGIDQSTYDAYQQSQESYGDDMYGGSGHASGSGGMDTSSLSPHCQRVAQEYADTVQDLERRMANASMCDLFRLSIEGMEAGREAYRSCPDLDPTGEQDRYMVEALRVQRQNHADNCRG